MMLAVLTTSERTDYLASTLEQIDAQPGTHLRHVFFDGQARGFERQGWSVHELPKAAKGNAVAFWGVLGYASMTGEDLIFFEDDVAISGSAVPYIEQFEVPADLAAVSFLTAFTSEVCPWGLYRAHGKAFMLAQSIKFPAWALSAILTARKRPQGVHSDTELGAALAVAGLRWGGHVPDLVRHVGDTSAANGRNLLVGTRIGRTYQGDNFDAVEQLRSANDTGLYG